MSMDARVIRHATVTLLVWTVLATVASAASVRGTNFLVTAQDPQLARQVLESAEIYRRDLAIEWLGHELPRWSQPCPISVKVGGGAGGQTSFAFHQGVPFNWTMEIFGPRDRILDSVLPHEILHTIFATHFGCPLPRWADEGACTTVEHTSEKDKNTQLLYRFLKTDRGIAFNQMFAMKEYPADILPLYAQGYSLARFLMAQGGKQKFVQYVGEGMQTNNWTACTNKYYGHPSLSSLQVSWLDWVRDGSNEGMIRDYAPLQFVSNTPSNAIVRGQSPQHDAPQQPRPQQQGPQQGADQIASARDQQSGPLPLTGPIKPVGFEQDITPREPGVSGGFYSRGGQVASQPEQPRTSAVPLGNRDIRQIDAMPVSSGAKSAPTFYLPGGTSLYR